MKMNPLGRTGLMVSDLCLGTMTFGTQTTAAEGHAQIELALERGINFIDTAEMYPVNPVRAETVGRTEEIIGAWIAANPARRDSYILATKQSGNGSMARGGEPITAATIPGAIEASLRRLKTDVIDLYQFHWPNRGSYSFRQNWTYDPSKQDRAANLANMQECLATLQDQIDKGNIRHFGLSNETAWGTTKWCDTAEASGGPRVASIQNEYSLLSRMYDTDLAEVSANEDVGLLSYSPLATGLLSGKYKGRVVPEGSRMSINETLGGRVTDRVFDAVEGYLLVAEKHDLDPVHMAIAWARERPFMTSVIFGATTLAQLTHILDGATLSLTPEQLADLDGFHRAYPMPY
ncbi:MAG: aldo/keto reductase [Thalassovita sp.]